MKRSLWGIISVWALEISKAEVGGGDFPGSCKRFSQWEGAADQVPALSTQNSDSFFTVCYLAPTKHWPSSECVLLTTHAHEARRHGPLHPLPCYLVVCHSLAGSHTSFLAWSLSELKCSRGRETYPIDTSVLSNRVTAFIPSRCGSNIPIFRPTPTRFCLPSSGCCVLDWSLAPTRLSRYDLICLER